MAYTVNSVREENAKSSQAGNEIFHKISLSACPEYSNWTLEGFLLLAFYFLIPHGQIIKPTRCFVFFFYLNPY